MPGSSEPAAEADIAAAAADEDGEDEQSAEDKGLFASLCTGPLACLSVI